MDIRNPLTSETSFSKISTVPNQRNDCGLPGKIRFLHLGIFPVMASDSLPDTIFQGVLLSQDPYLKHPDTVLPVPVDGSPHKRDVRWHAKPMTTWISFTFSGITGSCAAGNLTGICFDPSASTNTISASSQACL